MNSTRQTNTFSGGMNMDTDYSLISDKQYLYAENIRVLTNAGSSIGAIQNIEGFFECLTTTKLSNEQIIHTNTIRDLCIVFTKSLIDNTYSVYTIDFSKSKESPEVKVIINRKPLNINKNEEGFYSISSICRWESKDNIKCYFTDGIDEIKVINVDGNTDYSNITSNNITLIPSAVLPTLYFSEYGTGSLKSGSIQYCYQLFTPRSSSSVLSQISSIINIVSKDANDYCDAIGDQQDVNTGKSIKLKLDDISVSGFNRMRIFSIYYKSKHSIPTITIIDDVPFDGNKSFSYEDKGNQVTSEISIDEFNSLTGYLFSTKVLASKDNRLFAANITENTWDVEYDARAYRSDEYGDVYIYSKSGDYINFDSVDRDSMLGINKEFDCINPSNSSDYTKYVWTTDEDGSYILGGKGPNVSYRFVTTQLIEDDSTLTSNKVNEEFCHNVSKRNLNSLTLHYENSSTSNYIRLNSGNKIPNYSDPEIASKVVGYMRDEIYRFGIVLYNRQNIASPVHWIGDIKMPSMKESGYETFISGGVSDYGNNLAVVTKPLGIEFKVENLPDDVVRYEIVRCERTASDRTIVSQGIVSSVTAYDGDENNTLTPFPYLSYSNQHGYYARTAKRGDNGTIYKFGFDLSKTQSSNAFIFISPELCVNRENSESLIKQYKYIYGLGYLDSSVYHNPNTWGITYTNYKPFANSRVIRDGSTLDVEYQAGEVYSRNGTVQNGWIEINAYKDLSTYASKKKGTWYTALLSKYYDLTKIDGVKTSNIQYIKYAGPSDVFTESEGWPWLNTTGVSIGNNIYYNWVWDNIKQVDEVGDVDKTDANNTRKYGPHGICSVFKSDDLLLNIPRVTTTSTYKNITAVLLCNMKQNTTTYGGDSYSSIQNSVYISTGASANRDQNTIVCFGGDTFINIFDYNNCMFSYYPDDYEKDTNNRFYHGAFIPLESSINLALTHDSTSLNRTYESGNGYANHYVEDDIVSIGGVYSQSTPSYAYNDAYSAQSVARKFVSKSIYNIDNLHMDTRIIVSEMKTNNEVIDSWSNFKVSNYLDVDNSFGSINNMTVFKNRLFFWQTDAFGTVASNERSLISDNNPGALTLGTGDILERYEYYTTLNGEKENQLRANTQSDGAIYWYDAKRNELCSFNGNLNSVSKLRGVQSYLNNNSESILKDPIAAYDKKYNEALFTLVDNTLVFNERIDAFTSFYSYSPDYYAEFSDKLYTFKNLKLFKYNSGDSTNLYDDKAKKAYISFVVNQNYPISKTFDNVEYSGDFTHNTNFNEVYFETKRQTSYTLDKEDIDYREDTYKFCIPRNNIELNDAENLANKSYKDRMKGKYLICHYKYDCNNGNTFKVPYISTAYRQSFI